MTISFKSNSMVQINVLGEVASIEDTTFISAPFAGIDGNSDWANGTNSVLKSVVIISRQFNVTI